MPAVACSLLLGVMAVPAVLPPVLALLFWLWLAVALAIWILRLVRRLRRPKSPAATPATTPAATPPPLPTPDSGVAEHRQHRPEGRQNEGAGRQDEGAGRQGFFAPSPAAGDGEPIDGSRPPDAGRPTVVEAVEGIEMPCGLTPVVDPSVTVFNPFRAAFLTTDAGAAEVGAALGDELQRLGFTLTTPAATELLARKAGVELRVVLYPTATAARRGLDAIFPAAPDGAVGVELTT